MLRALLLGLVMLAAAGPARAAGDIDTCRNNTAEPVARLAACESVIADDKITGPSRAAAFWYRGDSLMKKRDYDGAIAAFSASHEIAPQNIGVINCARHCLQLQGRRRTGAGRLRSVSADCVQPTAAPTITAA